MYPSIRDQEYLQHSSLYGNQYISGGAGELKMPKQEIKTDSSLPAYCNPPNPCPVDYTGISSLLILTFCVEMSVFDRGTRLYGGFRKQRHL